MSDDPETVRQIAALSMDTRPLLVLDVDEVVLEFLAPFTRYLDHRGYGFQSESFRLHGNVVETATGTAAAADTVSGLLDDFFAAQEDWQTPAAGVSAALDRLSGLAEIVMLTAMPHAHRERRRTLLDRLGIPFPLVTTEKAKGPAVALLAGERTAPVAFVDDIPHNHASVQKHFPRAGLFHLMAHEGMRRLLPPLPPGVVETRDWADASAKLAAALAV
ncbi:hypothetical protein CSC94_05575 [Zhengella mangrovi]|uniref:HAD family hydrolase n=1 Tax=Zhengella mangrovi TaxID=1982044 RepID=A0A2G1QSE6_9HYPH|nr:hypothetical protein [Zhengella mangrovi]PHP68128.1 hypothetical protein CSC94_05575 [Zhengella mangrovi]